MQLIDQHLETETRTFTLRPARMDDLDAVLDLINASGMDQRGRRLADKQDILDDWKKDMFNIDTSTRVAEMGDGRLAGYIEVWDLDPVPVQNWVWARVHPQFEGLGIGTALMDWAESRLLETIERVEDPDLRVVYHTSALSSHLPTKQLFEERGMTLVRHFWDMYIELHEAPPEPVWPAGIRLQTYADKPDLRALFRADTEAFRDHWGFVEQPEDEALPEWQEWIDNMSRFDPELWFLAMDGDEIAGICLCTAERAEYPDAAWVNTLGVRPEWRRRGIALALLHHAFDVFYRAGRKGVGLGVDAQSLTGATKLYEKAGMSIAKQSDSYRYVLRPGRDISTR